MPIITEMPYCVKDTIDPLCLVQDGDLIQKVGRAKYAAKGNSSLITGFLRSGTGEFTITHDVRLVHVTMVAYEKDSTSNQWIVMSLNGYPFMSIYPTYEEDKFILARADGQPLLLAGDVIRFDPQQTIGYVKLKGMVAENFSDLKVYEDGEVIVANLSAQPIPVYPTQTVDAKIVDSIVPIAIQSSAVALPVTETNPLVEPIKVTTEERVTKVDLEDRPVYIITQEDTSLDVSVISQN